MMYYRVKDDCHDYPRYVYIGKSQKIKEDSILVANELYTPAERKKIANADKFFEKVEVSQRNTYWLFGARFENKTDEMIEREMLVKQGAEEQARLAFYND